MENPLEFGIVITREDGSIERFLEKPTWGQVFSDTINTGIYVLEPEVFDYIEPGEAGGLLVGRVSPAARRRACRCSATWPRATGRTSGTLDAYIKAHQDVLDAQVALDIPGFRLGDGIWLGEGSEIDPAATVDGPAIIGDYSRVEAGARLAEYTVLGSNVRVGAGRVHRAVGGARQRVPRPGCPAAGRGGRPVQRPAPGRPAGRRAWSSATSASSASTP